MQSLNIAIDHPFVEVGPTGQAAFSSSQEHLIDRRQPYSGMQAVHGADIGMNPAFHAQQWGSFLEHEPSIPDPNSVEVTPEMLEAFSYVEPISANVGAGFNTTPSDS